MALLATQTASLDDDELDAPTESLVQLADRLGGGYDGGWGTALR